MITCGIFGLVNYSQFLITSVRKSITKEVVNAKNSCDELLNNVNMILIVTLKVKSF